MGQSGQVFEEEETLLSSQRAVRKWYIVKVGTGICGVILLIGLWRAGAGHTPAKHEAVTLPLPKSTLYADRPPQYGLDWKNLITGTACAAQTTLTTKTGDTGGTITCVASLNGGRHFKFPPGEFDIDVQVVVPTNTVIEGNANPNDPNDPGKKPLPSTQTIFIATKGVTSFHTPYCGTNYNLQQGAAQNLRIGFLLNSNTLVKHINFQGQDTIRPEDNGNLCGGGAFETPGCVSPGFGDGVGDAWANPGKRNGCYDHTGKGNSLITGDGKGVQNVTIKSVRVNDYWRKPDGYGTYASQGQGTQVAVWVAQTQDGSPSQITVTNLVSMLTRGDGINFHGNVQNSVIEDCHIENTGDDIYAFWGAYAENTIGNIFRNNVGVNPGLTRNFGYGVCVAIYGAKDITVTGNKCYDRPASQWKNSACLGGSPMNCNSAFAMVHGGWFGAVYPEGNSIKIYGNKYYYTDPPDEMIPQTERPLVRMASDGVNLVTSPQGDP